ncbi:hypothetical protein [Campylobacter canadensis]|uniref:TIGR02221 family CRISPR-associated protein n=1 Tax=Campylobacter canadensis TaxID=449520 RepID=A0ABS7WSN4_9BACT|nr:hypothetical protein [Campylobacter canadensis]MBZ7987781.1 hypothetical protein [Campylobacter canadensis]MBZ7998578.1 hypothetical protein [Campylobacter canadensis]
MSEVKMLNKKGLQIIKKANNKKDKDNIMQDENTQNNTNINQTQEKSKIKIISFLGLSRGKNGAKARYNSDNFTLLDIKSGDYENATELLIDNYNDGLSDMQMRFFATQDAFNMQKDILQKCKIFDGDFDINHECFIKYNKTDYNELYKKLLDEIGNTSEKTYIIVDITHGFRDNTFLSILASLIQLNINKNRIIRFMVAKEIIQYQKYELVSLDEYIENMVMSNVLSTFKQCLKVPDYNLDNSLYLALKGFSDALFKNDIEQVKSFHTKIINEYKNIKDSDNIEYQNILSLIESSIKDLEFINSWDIQDIEKYYIYYYELSILYHSKDYILNAYLFLLEGIYLYVYSVFYDMYEENNRKYNYNKSNEMKNIIFYAHYKLYLKIGGLFKLRMDLANDRNPMTHCNLFDSTEYSQEYKKYRQRFFDCIIKGTFNEKFKNNKKILFENRSDKKK